VKRSIYFWNKLLCILLAAIMIVSIAQPAVVRAAKVSVEASQASLASQPVYTYTINILHRPEDTLGPRIWVYEEQHGVNLQGPVNGWWTYTFQSQHDRINIVTYAFYNYPWVTPFNNRLVMTPTFNNAYLFRYTPGMASNLNAVVYATPQGCGYVDFTVVSWADPVAIRGYFQQGVWSHHPTTDRTSDLLSILTPTTGNVGSNAGWRVFTATVYAEVEILEFKALRQTSGVWRYPSGANAAANVIQCTCVIRDELAAAINEALSRIESDYTPFSWEMANLDHFVWYAETWYANEHATQEMIDNATSALNRALGFLTLRANNNALGVLIAHAQSRNEASYTPGSWAWANLDAVLDILVLPVYSNLNAAQSQIDSAYQTLVEALAYLIPLVTVDRSTIEAAIAAAQSRVETNYTPFSWEMANLPFFIWYAQEWNSNLNASEAMLADATAALNRALGFLTPRANRDALGVLIANAQSRQEGNYTPFSWAWANLDAVLNILILPVHNNLNSTQGQLDSAHETLTAALAHLVPYSQGFNLEAFVMARAGITPLTDIGALGALIVNAQSRVEGDYTPGSWAFANLDAILTIVILPVYNNPNASSAMIEGAYNSLTDALAFLVPLASINRAALAAAISDAQSRISTNYTPFSWDMANLAFFISYAQSWHDNNNASQGQIDAATSVLNTALGHLVLRANRIALAALIIDAQSRVAGSYTTFSWDMANLAHFIPYAQGWYSNTNASQTLIDHAYTALSDALAHLVPLVSINRAALAALIADAQSRVAANYTTFSWDMANLANFIAYAQGWHDNQNASQTQINDAHAVLLAALAELIPIASINRVALAAAIASAQSRVAINYTPGSWDTANLAHFIPYAQAWYANAQATQVQINNATSALNAAMGLLALRASRDILGALMAKIIGLNEQLYTPGSWAAAGFAGVLPAAQYWHDNPNASAGHIQAQIDVLNHMLSQLVYRADRAELGELIKYIMSLDEELFTPESWAAANFELVLMLSQYWYDNLNASQGHIQTQIDALYHARSLLVLRTPTRTPAPPTTPSSPSWPVPTSTPTPTPSPTPSPSPTASPIPTPSPTPQPDDIEPDSEEEDIDLQEPDTPPGEEHTHHAFMVGFDDGTVRPRNPVTRAQVATIFFRLMYDEDRAYYWLQENPFSDVSIGNWFNNAVSTTTNMGLFSGMPDGTFQPNRVITRAEFAVAVARFAGVAPVHTASRLYDIHGHWAEAYINAMVQRGLIAGMPDGLFQPSREITRAEAAALINRTLGRLPGGPNDLLPDMITWVDNANPNAWYFLYIQEATNSHYFVMKDDGIHEAWTGLFEPRNWTLLEQPHSRPEDLFQ